MQRPKSAMRRLYHDLGQTVHLINGARKPAEHTMPELSEEEMEAVTDIRAAVFLISEKLRLGTQLSEDIRSTYDTIAGNTEFLRKYVDQIDKLKENIAEAASEVVSTEIAQLGAAYDVMQDDYNKKMNKMQKFMYASLLLNGFLVAMTVVDLMMSHW
jgi:hypothetical protein